MSTVLYGALARRFSTGGELSEELLFLQELTREEIMLPKDTAQAEIVHDIKNALCGVRTCAEVLSDEEMEPEERVSFVATIVTELDRLMQLSEELQAAGPGRRKRKNLTKCSLKELVEELLAVARCDFKKRRITIVPQFQEPGYCQIDITNMQRVIMNIISNARDAMPEGGQLTISLRNVEKRLQLEFSDNGCGMSPELQQHFLEPYVTEGKPYGTGLGMVIVKKILDQHGAELEVESQRGQGTTIRILFPCTQ